MEFKCVAIVFPRGYYSKIPKIYATCITVEKYSEPLGQFPPRLAQSIFWFKGFKVF